MKKLMVICLSVITAFMCCVNNTAGTSDEVVTGTKSCILLPDGKTPAVDASVKIFKIDDFDGKYVSMQTTDKNGHYSLDELPQGIYNIWAEKDSLVTYRDSVIITPSDTPSFNDTLGCASTITGIVAVEPQDNPISVTVQVAGLDKYFNNISNDGMFTINHMAKGRYNLLFKSTLPNYTPTSREIVVRACLQDTLKDTIKLVYAGIPIVTGISATYDTVNGTVRLSWTKTVYKNILTYLVYRDHFDSISISANPFAVSEDTLFYDTIFNKKAALGAFSFSDTNDYHLKYRVAIRNNVNETGQQYKFAEVTAVSPSKITTKFLFRVRHIAKGLLTSFSQKTGISGEASKSDSLEIIARITNSIRTITKLQWMDSIGNIISEAKSGQDLKDVTDSIHYVWTDSGIKWLRCLVTDTTGYQWSDTVRISIVPDIPKIQISIRDSGSSVNKSTGTIQFAFNDTIPLHASVSDKYGKITGITWKFGESSATQNTLSSDTFVVVPDSSNPLQFHISAIVTDDDGNRAEDTLIVTVDKFSPATLNAAFCPRLYQKGIVFNNKMWIFGGMSIPAMDPNGGFTGLRDVWTSVNGVTWNRVSSNAPYRVGHSMIQFNNKLWIIGGYSSSQGGYRNDIWESVDGLSWTCAIDSAPFSPRIFHSCIVFENKLWIIGGLTEDAKIHDVWSSDDGTNWTMITDSAGFSARAYHTASVYNSKMWVIGGEDNRYDPLNDVWCSSDGITWICANANTQLSPRQGHTTLVYNEKMWIFGGYGFGSSDMAEGLWSSTDGKTWVQAADSTCFAPRAFHSSLVFNNRMWVIAGLINYNSCTNDVWRSGVGIK